MAKIFVLSLTAACLFSILFLSGCSVNVISGQTPIEQEVYNPDTTVVPINEDMRERVQKTYKSQIGVRELTGNNDGPEVETYLSSVGLNKGYSWCAAFVKWCLDMCGIKTTITAWSPTAHNKKMVIYQSGKWFGEAREADVFTLYYHNLKRIGHTGFVDKVYNDKTMVQTVEGNTNGPGSREGDGVYLKFRPVKTINSITSWIY